jgi:hypothetical protein
MSKDNWITHAIKEMDEFDRGYEQGSKNMAKKILNEMYNYSKKYTWMCLSPDDIEMFADKYGVEIEEL